MTRAVNLNAGRSVPAFAISIFKKGFSMKAFAALLMAGLFAGNAFAAGANSIAAGVAEKAAASEKTTAAEKTAVSEKEPAAQQSRMATCNKDAAGKKGAERKAFMKDCLSGKADDKPAMDDNKKMASAAQIAQREKMKACNNRATGKKGEDRKIFMKDCLSMK